MDLGLVTTKEGSSAAVGVSELAFEQAVNDVKVANFIPSHELNTSLDLIWFFGAIAIAGREWSVVNISKPTIAESSLLVSEGWAATFDWPHGYKRWLIRQFDRAECGELDLNEESLARILKWKFGRVAISIDARRFCGRVLEETKNRRSGSVVSSEVSWKQSRTGVFQVPRKPGSKATVWENPKPLTSYSSSRIKLAKANKSGAYSVGIGTTILGARDRRR